jgi:alpha-glucosidase
VASAFALAAPAASAAPAAQTFGPYTLVQERLGPGLWYFQVFEDPPPEPPQSPLQSLLISPMLQAPERLVSPERFRPFPVKVRDGRPVLAVTREGDPGAGDGAAETVFEISPYSPDGSLAGLVFHGDGYSFAAGLGADLTPLAEGVNLLGKTFMPAGPHGPRLMASEFGPIGSLQIPVCYFLGQGKRTAAFFMNETRPLVWDFSDAPWTVSLAGPLNPERSLSFFVITGDDLPSVRRAFMALVGRPPVPPRSVFAPWITDSSGTPAPETPAVLTRWKSRLPQIPLLGGLFGGKASDLPFEEASRSGAAIMATESPYVPVSSPFFGDMARRGFLVREGWEGGPPATTFHGGETSALVDYSDPAAATYWHSLDRARTYEAGARVFLLLGGEPEAASPLSWYKGVSDPSSHSHYAWANRYGLKWLEGFTLAASQRPAFSGGGQARRFLLTRSGMGGMGRFGAGLYTQDPSLMSPRVEGQARTQSSLSGVDYYTTDVARFVTTWASDGPFRILYEAWGARNILLNLPLLLPDVFLDEPWARQLLEFKAGLEPYLYSLAHESSRTGDPLVSPLLYLFQSDPGARGRDQEFMLGPWILVGTGIGGMGNLDLETVTVYVPEGRWYDYFAGETLARETGGEIRRSGKVSGYLMPPVLLREGAIVPSSEAGQDAADTLAVKLFPGREPSRFVLYEDDGVSDAWTRGQLATTRLELATEESGDRDDYREIVFTARAREGSAPGVRPRRRFVLEFLGIGNPGTARLDGQILTRTATRDELEIMDSGWTSRGTGVLVFKTPPLDLSQDHTVVID